MNEHNSVRTEALVLDTETKEKELESEVKNFGETANSIIIDGQASFENAAESLKSIKTALKKVKDYWEPLRLSTKKAYDDVLSKKKEMVSPLEEAEKIIKSKMADYQIECERKRKSEEEALRLQAEKEAEKKLNEAIDAAESGDENAAEFAMTEAEIYENAGATITLPTTNQKVKGISTSKSWVIKKIDETLVPVNIAGIVIRPVDEKAVMSLIKASKGKVKIPGIEYEETARISVRA